MNQALEFVTKIHESITIVDLEPSLRFTVPALHLK